MIKTLILWIGAVAILAPFAVANDQMRDWKLTSGKGQQAELLAFDESSRTATLRLADQSELTIQEGDLSTIDRAWILQWIERSEEAEATLERVGGSISEHRSSGEFATDYAVYHPPLAENADAPPMLILFHPGGNGRRAIYRYIESAAATGFTLVSLDHFRNTGDDSVAEAEMLTRFKSLLPQVESTVEHDKSRVFMGGVSGGAWRGYHYSAQVERPWAGILSYVGWLGGQKWYALPYPKMRVAMVNGDKDTAANSYVDPDSERLQEAGSVISVHAFEGGHQLAPPSVQTKAMRWLIEEQP